MAVILSLESSTSVCSAALHRDGELTASSVLNVPQSAASKLSVIIDQLFKVASVSPAELNAIAVSAGPGSYTGLRIGVATAKGLCFALDIPLIAINTLELLATQVSHLTNLDALLCPMLDARRMEVYTMLLDFNLRILEPTRAKVIDELSYHQWLTNHVVMFFGSGADKCQQVINHMNARFIQGIYPSAEKLGELAFQKLRNQEFENLAAYEPFYLKDFVAKKPKATV